MRTAAKRDEAEGPIVEALEAVGAEYYLLSDPGGPDILVAFRGRWTPLEVKSAKGRLRPRQVTQQLARLPFPIVRTPEDALREIGAG